MFELKLSGIQNTFIIYYNKHGKFYIENSTLKIVTYWQIHLNILGGITNNLNLGLV